MAKIIWTEPALDQLDEIGEYVALDNLAAARKLVAKVFKAMDRLQRFPNSGRAPPELPGSVYREVVCSPCRVFYRRDGKDILVLHVMREEMELRKFLLNSQSSG